MRQTCDGCEICSRQMIDPELICSGHGCGADTFWVLDGTGTFETRYRYETEAFQITDGPETYMFQTCDEYRTNMFRQVIGIE